MVTIRSRFRLARWECRLLDLVVVVAVGRNVVGVWPTALVLAAWCLSTGLRAWHRWENRPTTALALVPEIVPAPRRRPSDRRGLGRVAVTVIDLTERDEHCSLR